MMEYKFTIYTPVFNSAKFLDKVYKSLLKQNFKNFEWIIINDGSVDDSSKVINTFILEKKLVINFIDLKENIGFTKSMNLAVRESKGEFFLIFHSDDEMAENALQILNDEWENLNENEKLKLQGVKCLCNDQYGKIVGDLFPKNRWVGDMFDLIYKYKIYGEKWGFIKTNIMKEFPFPEDDKFVPESVVWFRQYKKYKALFINVPLRTYYVNHNPNSLMARTSGISKHPLSKRIQEIDFINLYFKRILRYPVLLIKIFTRFWAFSFSGKEKILCSLKKIESFPKKAFASIFLPLGYVYFKKSV
jgi:glycosyltransferase involved in cell wall biosynthesis